MPAWFTALVSAFDFATPLALLLLPLPLAARLIPPEREGGSGALRVPPTLVRGAEGSESIAARGRRRLWLIGTLWVALVVALAGPRTPASMTRAARATLRLLDS